MPRPYKDKIPLKSEQFGFGGEVKSEILNHSVPKAPFPSWETDPGAWEQGWEWQLMGERVETPSSRTCTVSLKGLGHLAGRPRRYKFKLLDLILHLSNGKDNTYLQGSLCSGSVDWIPLLCLFLSSLGPVENSTPLTLSFLTVKWPRATWFTWVVRQSNTETEAWLITC